MKSFLEKILNERAAMVYIALFAIAIAVATFIENDFGTSAAQKWVYKAKWFEVLLLLFGGAMVRNMSKYKLLQRKRYAVLLFHLSMIVILLGAGVTRYFGYEGILGIREGAANNTMVSSDPYLVLTFEDENGAQYAAYESTLFSSLGPNGFSRSYEVAGRTVDIDLQEFVANPQWGMEADPTGVPMLAIVIAGQAGRKEHVLQWEETRSIEGGLFHFGATPQQGCVNILGFEEPQVVAEVPMTAMTMATQAIDSIPAATPAPIRYRSLYDATGLRFVFTELLPSAKEVVRSEALKVERSSEVAQRYAIRVGDAVEEVWVTGMAGALGRPVPLQVGGLQLGLAYGARRITLPFSIALRDFEMERYPGTNSPASYASEVTIVDTERGVDRDFRIYMNHILDYRGFRFFQSSYDRDEQGTYLSVNHDFWGTWISYIGYILLTVGMVWTLFSKSSRFRDVAKRLSIWVGLVCFSALQTLSGQTQPEPLPTIAEVHAERFAQLIVQDNQGRMKPTHTLNREVIRKLLGSETYQDMTSDQVVLGIFADPEAWYGEPLIQLGKHEEIKKLIGVTGKRACFRDFFHEDGSYKLQAVVQAASEKDDADKGMFEKTLMKVDERVNIFSMLSSGWLLRIVPVENDPNNTWVGEAMRGQTADPRASRFFAAYRAALSEAIGTGDYTTANGLLTELDAFQRRAGVNVLPSDTQRAMEIKLNEWRVFKRLAWVYTLLGLAFLTFLFSGVIRGRDASARAKAVMVGLVAAAFVFHTVGLGLRWYVSERAPWSNGYESMIYIAWTTVLAGLMFVRRSVGAMAATMVQSGVILLIALLSYLNPEITPLVPVLNSYWLTIHVSLEAGSYGFLMLGAIIGFVNLALMAITSQRRHARIKSLVREMTWLSELTLTGGLFMLSVGTYLGGVWANESWGRYWGWDAKETWALVSILVYAFILHMRLIPKLAGTLAFNIANLVGLASIIMTYYGVNYYLSGLHSYAAGDPVPIPNWVYISVAAAVLVSTLAARKARSFRF